ncbi:hypothetical protein AMECASPLE_016562 [Ameca splendens]|uniref:Uncharacterized protein n=1 Tax=Ameca splendens TaxID=208324 RepID=A0ABV0XFA5_9TELE
MRAGTVTIALLRPAEKCFLWWFSPKKMNCFNQRFRRTAPAHGSSKSELVPSKTPRINGWSWPLQPLQVVGWLVLIYLTVVTFGIFIPLLPRPWNAVSYARVSSSKSVEMVQASVRVAFLVSPFGGFPGTSRWEETLGMTPN